MACLRLSKPYRVVGLAMMVTCLALSYSKLHGFNLEQMTLHPRNVKVETNFNLDEKYHDQDLSATISFGTQPRLFPWKPYKAKDVDCRKLFAGDASELSRSVEIAAREPVKEPSESVTALAGSCMQMTKLLGFITDVLTSEEEEFPIAYSILVYKDAVQVLNLLRAIYRPQNYYCIHVDAKSDTAFREAMTAMVKCFNNVFLSSRSVDVVWGTFSVLEPELICMQDLWKYKSWKYFINLTGQEFPLRTNYELVQILTAYNGANDLEGTVKRANKGRWAGAPPHGLIPVKGSVHITVNRDFVDYVLHSPVAQDLLNWSKPLYVPDEVFFATLNHNPQLGIRGSFKGEPETHPFLKPFLTRFKNWGRFPFDYPCKGGKRVRGICILSVHDLPLLNERPELFANKFHQDYSRFALDCLAEKLFNNTRDEFLGRMKFDATYYKNVSFVKNMVTNSMSVQESFTPIGLSLPPSTDMSRF